ncbi:MAG TPA: hypothetical protein P5193_13260, partial [Microthrixaceae bacterium]|nr:hypothetical protein [Microthrixaceae bacterium]
MCGIIAVVRRPTDRTPAAAAELAQVLHDVAPLLEASDPESTQDRTAGLSAAAPDAASSMVARSASTPTVSPSAATISAILPAEGLGTSTVTLSVSSSHSISSWATASPGFLNHVATVASVTDSPRVGTRTSVVMVTFLRWSAR